MLLIDGNACCRLAVLVLWCTIKAAALEMDLHWVLAGSYLRLRWKLSPACMTAIVFPSGLQVPVPTPGACNKARLQTQGLC